jgi:pyruvate,orthophosphate dikinase
MDMDLLNDEKMATALFDAINSSLRKDSAGPLSDAVFEVFPLFPKLSGRARDTVARNLPLIMKKLIGSGRPDACRAVLNEVRRAGPPLTEEILMHPGIALSILGSGNDELTREYRALLMQIVVPSAKVRGLSPDTWAELVNPLHLERLSKFLDILQRSGGRLRDVLVHVAVNLYVSGVLIPDDKLFQRTVSAYLNFAAAREHLLPNYLLLKKLPVYFNEVGATSVIRDYSTEIDSWGNDPALYFLRKQVHVNASNYNIRLIEELISSWLSNDPSLLRSALPPDVFAALKPAQIGQYAVAIKPFLASLGVFDNAGLHLERLRDATDSAMEKIPRTGSDETRAKILLLCKLYRELVKKYSFLGGTFDKADLFAALSAAVERVRSLNRIVLSPEETVAQESLYFKRHIAFGIPSVLGSYHEPKFDALGELLREEGKIGVMLEEVIAGIAKDKAVRPRDVAGWIAALRAAYELLVLRGFRNFQIDELVTILESNALRLSQVVDLLAMWQKELRWMVELFNRTFLKPLTNVLRLYPLEELPDALTNLDPRERDFEHKAADIIIRDMLSDVPGLVESDRLIEKIINALADRTDHDFDDELNADAAVGDRGFFPLCDLADEEAMRLAPLLGGKAKNLVYLRNRGFPVPPGVVLSSLHTERYREYTEGPEFLTLLKQAVRNIEEKTGAVYGGSSKPLFLSVRSGSTVSMPGILSSLLYCGMNSRTLEAFTRETGDPRLAWDAYRRFIEHYGTVVLGINADLFDGILENFMKKNHAAGREALGPDQLKEIVGLYNAELSSRGLRIPEDVYEQLRMSVRAVYASWYGVRAEQFRKATALSGQWGTAVTLMQMISGNAAGSGASVFFTRDPFTAEPVLYGESRENATGDDLVRGRQSNRPLARAQAGDGGESIEELDPELFGLHRELAKKVEDAMGGLPQEVEVTYTKDRDGKRSLFVLQTRRMEFGGAFSATFDEICGMESRIIGRGVGAHGGALSGAACFASSPEQAAQLKEKTGLPLILLRKTANTDDVSLMQVVRGIITAAGGVTSHAAVLAQKFDVTAVVACSALSIETGPQDEAYAKIGDTVIREGALISIDGATGLVFSGACLSTTRAYRT